MNETITITPASSAQEIEELYLELLQHLATFDRSFDPTPATARWWTANVFWPAAQKGEPVLMARDDSGRAIGAIFWTIGPAPGLKTAFGYGTYIRPRHRRLGIGKALRAAAVDRLKAIGTQLLVGCAHSLNEPGRESLLALGMTPTATLYHLRL